MQGQDEKEKFSLYPWVVYFDEPVNCEYLFLKPNFAPLIGYLKDIIEELYYNKGVELRNQAESMQPPEPAPPVSASRSAKAEKLQSPNKRSKVIQKAQDSDSPMKKSKFCL
jgi:hypothetical protein